MVMNCQRGLSLVEIMVTLLIGCFLIMGISQIYIDNRGAYFFQQGQASNLSKSRFAVLVMEDLIARAGYRAEPWVSLANSFPAVGATSGCPAFAAGETVKKNSQGSGVCVRYLAADDADGDERDCIGDSVADGAEVVLDIDYDSTEETLNCRIGSRSAVLVDAVAGFAIGDLPAATDDAQAVRFALLLGNSFRDIGEAVDSDALARWNSLSGQNLSADSEQTQVFQIVQGSVALRNLMP